MNNDDMDVTERISELIRLDRKRYDKSDGEEL